MITITPRIVWINVSDPDFKGFMAMRSIVYSDNDHDILAPYAKNEQVRMYTFWGVDSGEYEEEEF